MPRTDEPHREFTDGRPPDAERQSVERYHSVFSGEDTIRTVVDALGEGVSIVDEEQQFLFVNPRGECLFGLEGGGLIGRRLWEFVPPEGFDLIREQLSTRRRGGRSTYDLEIVREDGKTRQLMVTASPRFSDRNRFRGALAVFRDITDRERAKREFRDAHATLEAHVRDRTQEFRESRDLLRTVIEGTSDVIFAKDLDGRYRLLNSAGGALFGRSIQQVIGKTDYDILPPEQADQVRSEDERVIESGESITVEETLSVNGGDLTFLTTRALLRDENGNVTGIVGIARDITEFTERADTGDAFRSGLGSLVKVHKVNSAESTSRKRARFGAIAVKMGFITPTDLEEALAQKAREPLKPLGEILLDRGCLTAQQVMQVLDELVPDVNFISPSTTV